MAAGVACPLGIGGISGAGGSWNCGGGDAAGLFADPFARKRKRRRGRRRERRLAAPAGQAGGRGGMRLPRNKPLAVLRLLGEAGNGTENQRQRDNRAGALDIILNH